jgi:hypothetical protein
VESVGCRAQTHCDVSVAEIAIHNKRSWSWDFRHWRRAVNRPGRVYLSSLGRGDPYSGNGVVNVNGNGGDEQETGNRD